MKKKAIIVSGYFNPIHKGHLEYFNEAKALAEELIVIVNNDHQRALKKSQEFQSEDERVIIVSNIKAVDKSILSIDTDRTVCATLRQIAQDLATDYDLAFANGGDQNNDTIPERAVCEEIGISLIDGLGEKIQSSSWLLKQRKPSLWLQGDLNTKYVCESFLVHPRASEYRGILPENKNDKIPHVCDEWYYAVSIFEGGWHVLSLWEEFDLWPEW